jgi:uroporphyrinogen decarboxylase
VPAFGTKLGAVTDRISPNVAGSPDLKLLTGRERFLRACRCQPVDRPPVWLMRQAGRVLPEYRALKEKYTFLELVRTPQRAAEVTLQPIERFGFDAAIIFSDILVVPEALGQPYEFREGEGILMEPLRTAAEIDQLDPSAVAGRLAYVADALRLSKKSLGERTALIGFAGSPWTLANFMLEGGGAREYTKAKALFYSDRPLFDALLQKLTTAITAYLDMQIDAGIDAFQIFDSLGGLLPERHFAAAAASWMTQIISRLEGRVPAIVFSKGTHGNWNELVDTGAQILGIDWTVRLSEVRARLPETVGVQGNLDPFLLTTTPERVADETRHILQEMRGSLGHIFNLGHGVPPTAKLENVASLVDTIRTIA